MMADGAGKYGDVLTAARFACGSRAAILIVLDGAAGPGFSVQAPPHALAQLPEILRRVADAIEADLRRGLN